MDPVTAAYAAGWVFILGHWYSTDWEAIACLEHPPRWTGTATDLCLGHGIEFVSPDNCRR